VFLESFIKSLLYGNSFIFLVSPYVRKSDDRMQIFAQLEILMLLIAGYVLQEDGLADSFDKAMVTNTVTHTRLTTPH
jgi:hypothetical protein